MINTGIVHESALPYVLPMVVVKKKDESNRICVDYCKLNRITVIDPEPMTTADDLFFRNLDSANFSQKLIQARLLADNSGGCSQNSFCKERRML